MFFIFLSLILFLAQQPTEAMIRGLENEEREAILKSDTGRLYQLMSSEIVVHNPENTIVNFRQIMNRVKAGKIDYNSFERIIEKVTVFNNTVGGRVSAGSTDQQISIVTGQYEANKFT